MATRKKVSKQTQKKSRAAKPALMKGSQRLLTRQGALVAMGVITLIGLIAVVTTFAATNGSQNSSGPTRCSSYARAFFGSCRWPRPYNCPAYNRPRYITKDSKTYQSVNTWDSLKGICKKKLVRVRNMPGGVGGTVR